MLMLQAVFPTHSRGGERGAASAAVAVDAAPLSCDQCLSVVQGESASPLGRLIQTLC